MLVIIISMNPPALLLGNWKDTFEVQLLWLEAGCRNLQLDVLGNSFGVPTLRILNSYGF